MAIAFFIAIKVLFFFSSISFQPATEQSTGYVDNPVSSESISNSPDGKVLFSQNCASCHAVNKRLTGPALAGVLDRVPDKKLLYEWIRNSEKILKSKNVYFTQLYNEYDKISMNKFPDLTDAQIEAILKYITAENAKPNSLPIAASQ